MAGFLHCSMANGVLQPHLRGHNLTTVADNNKLVLRQVLCSETLVVYRVVNCREFNCCTHMALVYSLEIFAEHYNRCGFKTFCDCLSRYADVCVSVMPYHHF